MKSIGIDIGTTTISMVVIDNSDYAIVRKITLSGGAFLPTANPWERLQDVSGILAKVHSALEGILADFPDISSIGLTGQMHGIVYLNQSGKAVSPLYTWQDGRGNLPCFEDGRSLCSVLSEAYGIKAASGYGLVTHLYNVRKNLVPAEASSVCTAADYLGMELTGRTAPLLHISQAAGLGFYDCKENLFLRNIVNNCGINCSILPAVTEKMEVLGSFRGIPVSVSLGDNQASFLGSVRDGSRDLLVNIGTGSQISLLTKAYAERKGIETRPFTEGCFLLVGAAICGGSAFAMLEGFFREYAAAAGAGDTPQYDTMLRLIEEPGCRKESWHVRTTFAGTREHPEETGSIEGIRTDNFHPAALIRGVLNGMAEELHSLYLTMKESTGFQGDRLIASGNGVRKNPALRRILQDCFGMPLEIVPQEEEAAYGAALSSLSAIGQLSLSQWMGL